MSKRAKPTRLPRVGARFSWRGREWQVNFVRKDTDGAGWLDYTICLDRVERKPGRKR